MSAGEGVGVRERTRVCERRSERKLDSRKPHMHAHECNTPTPTQTQTQNTKHKHPPENIPIMIAPRKWLVALEMLNIMDSFFLIFGRAGPSAAAIVATDPRKRRLLSSPRYRIRGRALHPPRQPPVSQASLSSNCVCACTTRED